MNQTSLEIRTYNLFLVGRCYAINAFPVENETENNFLV